MRDFIQKIHAVLWAGWLIVKHGFSFEAAEDEARETLDKLRREYREGGFASTAEIADVLAKELDWLSAGNLEAGAEILRAHFKIIKRKGDGE